MHKMVDPNQSCLSGGYRINNQSQKDTVRIQNLQQELDVVKKEKRFIQDKLTEVSTLSPDLQKEHDK